MVRYDGGEGEEWLAYKVTDKSQVGNVRGGSIMGAGLGVLLGAGCVTDWGGGVAQQNSQD